MDAPWRIEMLGWLRATQGERVVSRFRAQKTGALLAYLGYFRQRSHPREELIELLWPEAPPRSGRNNLSRELNSLRHQLEPPDVPAGAIILATRDWVQLNPAACVTDVAEFEASLLVPGGTATDAERVQRLEAAVGLYRGELLPGYFEDWILPERQRLAEAYLQAVGQWIALLEQAGDFPKAMQWATRAVAADPLREESHQELIRLLLASGRSEAALRQYEELEWLLAQELCTAPAAETQALVAGCARRKEASYLDRQRKMKRPAVTPETAAGAGHTVLSPLSPSSVLSDLGPVGYLPLQLNRFFDRAEEMERLQELLLERLTRLVTLTGPGGTGKTRLALQVAHQLREPLRGAVLFVSLLDLTDSRLIPDKVLDVLRLSRSPHVEPVDQVAAFFARRPALLVLDNFEHLVEEGAALVQTMLERVETLTCLVTSRQRLNLPGEREFAVEPLPVPGDRRDGDLTSERVTPACLMQYAGTQLFVDRAQAVRPDFQVTAANGAAVAALCQRLEGLPLALELAAARAGVLTPRQMLHRLEQRFDLLVSRQRSVDPRHRSLRATLDWSCHLLALELRPFFARLSVFRGGWTLEAAEAVCEQPNAWEYLEQLRECSLVLAEEIEGEIRFRLLETLREYASEQLTPDETFVLRRRHAGFLLAMAETAEPKLTGPEQEEWLARLEREHDNLRAALEWAAEAGAGPGGRQDGEVGLRLGSALWRFWDIRGYSAEGKARLIRLLALPGAERRTPERARALHAAGWLAYRQGDHQTARVLSEESLAMARELSDPSGIAASIYTLASVAREQGDYETGRSLYQESLVLWRALKDQCGAAACLCDLGLVANAQGTYDLARSRLEESLALCRQIGDRRGVARSLSFQGVITYGQSDYPVARSLYEESLALQRALGDRGAVTQSLLHLGNVALQQNDDAAARALFEESLSLARESGEKADIASALNSLGRVARREDDVEQATALCEEGLALCRELGERRGIAWSLENLGHLALDRGDWQAAGSLYAESLAIRRDLGQKRGIAESLEDLAAVANGQGQAERAARLFAAAAALRQQIGAPIQAADRADYERHLAATRAALGEAAFAAAWVEGEAMTLELATSYASLVSG